MSEESGTADGEDESSGAHGATAERGSVRRDRLERHPTTGPRNSLWSWPTAKSPLAVVRNYVVIVLARIAPSLRLKNWLLSAIGVTVGTGVAWGLESTPDVFWPERITVADHAIVGYDVTLLCHEFLQDEYRLGDVVVGERAMIGAGATVLPGVTIGAGARVAANSLVATDVPPRTTVAGVPATVVSRAVDDDDAGTNSDSDGLSGSRGR
ncbi:acyltransferase [Halorubrum sp. SY-15]|uniref:acyltransferase n=1 Tax=Halorubrum sp. SY-15 TaxID=3402277 RepID=UPI003EC0C696